jgi:hypothetical protein
MNQIIFDVILFIALAAYVVLWRKKLKAKIKKQPLILPNRCPICKRHMKLTKDKSQEYCKKDGIWFQI